MSADLVLSGDPLTTADVLSVARSDRPVGLSQAARARVAECRAALDAASSDGLPHYGVNTGFGSFSRERVSDEELRALQVNLVRSHAAGAGDPLPRDVVRGMMLLTAASLARGVSGVRPEVIDTLLSFLNKGVTPVVPELGSVGASGDLAPLAHVALALIGEGPTDGDSDGVAIAPLGLEAKEGLALLNGTHLMAARASLAVEEMNVLLRAAAGIAAVSLDATRSTDRFLDPRVYEARNQPGPSRVASAMLSALEGSTIVSSHVENDPRVQDPYSIRCAPIVLGSVLDQLDAVRAAVSNELGAVTDNPLVFGAGAGRPAEIVSAGNFHGMPVAIPLDTIALLCAHVAGISERRLYYLVSARDPELQLRP
ncbi:MAG: aromatic amino acid ammonia-lyase, partial [Planctomycetota bacterium]